MATTTSEIIAATEARDGELILVDMAFQLCREVADEARAALRTGEATAEEARRASMDAAWSRYQDAIAAPVSSPRREMLRHARATYNALAVKAAEAFENEVAGAREAYVAALEAACAQVEAAVGAATSELEPAVEEPAGIQVPVPPPGDQRSLGPRPSPRTRRILRHGLHAA